MWVDVPSTAIAHFDLQRIYINKLQFEYNLKDRIDMLSNTDRLPLMTDLLIQD